MKDIIYVLFLFYKLYLEFYVILCYNLPIKSSYYRYKR